MASAGAQVALKLTPEQKERLLAARIYLLAQMMEIIQERTLIISMLQVRKLDLFMLTRMLSEVPSFVRGSLCDTSACLPDVYPGHA